MPDISAALVLLKKPLEAIGEVATGKAKEIITRIKVNSNLKKIYTKLNATQKVKTIWNVDRAIALSSFYYPAKIIISNDIRTISKLDDLPSKAVVLSGTVGQGKSILLRYLLGKEVRGGERVPLLIELRRISAVDLENAAIELFSGLVEIQKSPEIFNLFAQNGRLSLLLDGFDELDPDSVAAMTTSIEKLVTKFPHARVIVTSRPGSSLEASSLFEIVPLAPLSEDDLPKFFRKILLRDQALAERLTDAVLKSRTDVKSLASTPLLATLLTIVYRANQTIPADFFEFYDELFQILLVRHDRYKPGYERKRKTKVSDREIQQIFEAFCYKSRADGSSSLSKIQALALAGSSIKSLGSECNESHFIDDIVKVTCLLQEEGGHIEFVHQSVREFFAARYIQSRPDGISKKFYSLLIETSRWMNWDQELNFLFQIDKFRSSQYFFIPALKQTLIHLESLSGLAEPSRLSELIADKFGVRQIVQNINGRIVGPRYQVDIISSQNRYKMDFIRSQLFDKFFGTHGIVNNVWTKCFDGTTNGQFCAYSEIALKCGKTYELFDFLINIVAKLKADFEFHQDRVKKLNLSAEFMDL